MIHRDRVIPLILEACPSFRETWDESDDKDLLYVVMGDLARHLLRMYRDKRTESFPAVCEVVERLHLEGDSYVRELATIGLLEGIQNVWANNDAEAEDFGRLLLPESRRWWKELIDFDAGKIPYVGAGVHTK
jgi:hypothetical protein